MPIFSQQEKESIIIGVQTKYQCSSDTEFKMYVEVIAGLQIINKVLGINWYNRAKQQIQDSDLESKQKHPINHYLRLDKPENMVQLMHFASCLRDLYDTTNLAQKVKEFTGKRKNSPITVEDFDKFHTEIKVASVFVLKGFDVEFLKENKNKKTPDLKISGKDGSALLECKRKTIEGKFNVDSLLSSITTANQQLETSTLPGIIYIDIPLTSNIKIGSKFREVSFNEIFPELKTVHYIVISGEWQEVISGRARHTTFMYPYENKMSDRKLPPSIQDIFVDIHPPPNKPSLLDD
ncbi:MAG TPA: hypothetical protein VIH04_03745 [Nitrosarchaeum sp.]